MERIKMRCNLSLFVKYIKPLKYYNIII